MTTDQLPMTADLAIGQPGDGDGRNSGLQAAIDRWQAANRQAQSARPFAWARLRTFVWIAVGIAGLLAAAVIFPALWGRAGQPLLIHNPYVER